MKAMEERGRRFVIAKIDAITKSICSSDAVRRASEGGSDPELAAAVAGAIESFVMGTALSPLAALMCKRGVNNLCQEHWK